MITSHSALSVRPQQDSSDRGAQFRALASGPGSALLRAGSSTERRIDRARNLQTGLDDAEQEDLSLPVTGCKLAHDESQILSSGGASVSSLLASLLVEAARKSDPAADHWKLLVPLERARFPDSAALISSGPGLISVQFRSCHSSVVSMLGPIVDSVGQMARQALGRPVELQVCRVATLAELYQ